MVEEGGGGGEIIKPPRATRPIYIDPSGGGEVLDCSSSNYIVYKGLRWRNNSEQATIDCSNAFSKTCLKT